MLPKKLPKAAPDMLLDIISVVVNLELSLTTGMLEGSLTSPSTVAGTLATYWLMLTRPTYTIKISRGFMFQSNGIIIIRQIKLPIPGINPANTPANDPSIKGYWYSNIFFIF
jgi:hypothetical protein